MRTLGGIAAVKNRRRMMMNSWRIRGYMLVEAEAKCGTVDVVGRFDNTLWISRAGGFG